MNKISILGGAFNPIHNGHLFIAKESIRTFGLEKVIFVPTGNPAFQKEDLLDKFDRAKLVEIAVNGEQSFEISLFEVEREVTSYYIDTLNYFLKKYSEVYTIMGEDSFLEFHRWKDYKEIVNKTRFIIAERFGDGFKRTSKYIEVHFRDYSEKFFFLPHPLFRISSTFIRERIKENKPISYLVPEGVEKEIVQKNYYKKP